jgi:predicted PhzF superfamily epimerase YddE/YHI9
MLVNVEVILVSSFTANGAGGNPAGVVFNADKLSSEQKLKIAQAVGYLTRPPIFKIQIKSELDRIIE